MLFEQYQDWPLMLLGGAALLVLSAQAVLIVVLFRRVRRNQQQLEAQQEATAKSVALLTHQVELLNKGSVGIGKRLMATEKRLNQTMERQEEIESKEWEQASYSQASKLIEKGVALNDVVDKVGISRSEARLVDLIRRKTLETHE